MRAALRSSRPAHAARLIVPAVWLGMILAIDGIEAPLKFTAPGITIPLGLGIGRLVFTAMNLVEAVLLVVLAIALWRSAHERLERWLAMGLGAIVVLKLAVLRPLLAARTDAVIAGLDDGGSLTHYFYIAADCVLAVLLVWFLVRQVRGLLPAQAPAEAGAGLRVGGDR